MSKRTQTNLHIEWAPGQVRAVNTASGQRAAAGRVGELGEILNGQRDALVGVGRSLVFLKTARLPKAAPEDLRRILMVQVGQLFPLPADQLSFDFIQTENQTADGFLTVVAAVRSQDLKQLLAELQQAGIRAARIMPVAFGAIAVARRAGLSDALTLEGSANGLALDVVQDGLVRYSRLAPNGGDAAAEAQRTLAAAGASELPLVVSEGVAVAGAASAGGSTLELLGDSLPFSFELQEERLKAQKRKIETRTRFAFLMMAAALLLVTLLWVERGDAQAIVTRSQGTWTRDLSRLRSIRDTENKAAQLATSIDKTLDSAFQPAQPLSDVLTVIGDSMPQSIWLTGISIERGKPIQIRGTAAKATDVARLVDSLGTNPRFRDVRLVFANSAKVEETPIVQFSITATAVGNLPMPIPPKKTSKATARKSSTTGTTGTTGDAAKTEVKTDGS